MNAAILWLCLLCAAVLFSVGTARLIGWMIRRRAARVDSAYRAACMIAEARAAALRTTCRLVSRG